MLRKNCKICADDNSSLYLEKDNFEILKCNSCSMVYLNHDPNADWFEDFYSDKYFVANSDQRGYENYQDCETFLRINFKRRIKQLSQYVSSGNVLDLGCGYGFFLSCLGEAYTKFGLDVSEHAVHIAYEKYGLDVRNSHLEEDTFPTGFFSLITMWDVIEHLPDPKTSLEILHKNLKDDGVIAIMTGNVNSLAAKVSGKRWHLYTLPEHLWFFSPQTLTKLLDKTGFRVLELRTEWCYYSIDYIIERLMKTVFKNNNLLYRIPFRSFLTKLVIPLNLYDTTYVVCNKK